MTILLYTIKIISISLKGSVMENKQPNFINTKKSFILKLREWVLNHRKLSISICVVLVVALVSGGVTLAIILNKPKIETKSITKSVVKKPKTKPTPTPKKYYAPLTGREVPDEASTKRAITAIMIENSPAARPQSGLQGAEITYEAIAEGGITRFLNLYQQSKPGLIGPVRSLRPYYVDWLAPWQASVAHVGGSKRSLDEIRNGKYRDIDQFFNGGSYWRSTDRWAPHNVYTNFEKLDALNSAKGYIESTPPAIKRAPTSAKSPKPNATNISVTMSGATYNSSWIYNPEANNYQRSQAGAPHLDREAGQITSDIVVILKMQMNLVQEDGWRENYNSSGEGTAIIFQNGTVHEVTWRKPATADQLSFIGADGKDFLLSPGKLWISAVPANKNGGVTWQ